MASSSSQLLINEGELNEILRIISVAKDPELKIVGNLFGLWSYSLMQPVVHLITGPGERSTISKKTFSPDGVYHLGMKKYLEQQHGLLQIGLWCSGNSNRYPSLNRGHPDYDLYNPLMPEKGRYVVLMFVDNHTKGNLEIEYQIIDREGQESSRIASLTTRDVLPGASSFRLLEPVFEKINQPGVKFPSQRHQYTGYFSTSMLPTNDHQPPAKITPSYSNITPTNGNAYVIPTSAYVIPTNAYVTPSKAAAVPASMGRPSQSHESDGGDNLFKSLVDGFKSTTYL